MEMADIERVRWEDSLSIYSFFFYISSQMNIESEQRPLEGEDSADIITVCQIAVLSSGIFPTN